MCKNERTEKYNHDERIPTLTCQHFNAENDVVESREKLLSHSSNFEKSTYDKRCFKKQKFSTEYHVSCRKPIERKRFSTSSREPCFKKRCIEENCIQKSKACRSNEERQVNKKGAEFAAARERRNMYLQRLHANRRKIDKKQKSICSENNLNYY